MTNLPSVYGAMAVRAEGQDVVGIEPGLGIASPRLDVMKMETAPAALLRATFDAAIAISSADHPNELAPLGACVSALPFGGAAVDVVRVQASGASSHSVAISTQPRLRHRRFLAEKSPGLV